MFEGKYVTSSNVESEKALPSTETLHETDVKKETFEMPDGSIYEGSMKGKCAYGQGKIVWKNGSVLTGFFDTATVRGVMKFGSCGANCEICSGAMPYSKYHDVFTFWHCSKRGIWNGLCKLKVLDYYEGEFSRDPLLFHGMGKLVFKNKHVFEGKFQNGFFFSGKQIGPNCKIWTSNVFVGHDGMEIGNALYQFASGAKYKGQWCGNCRDDLTAFYKVPCGGHMHGHGLLTMVNKDFLSGNFVADRIVSGTGKLSFENGSSYVGHFQDARFSQIKEIASQSWDKYSVAKQTAFCHMTQNGVGKLIHASGESYEGQFLHGKYHGKGKWVLSNGDCFEGTLKENKLVYGEIQYKCHNKGFTKYKGSFDQDVFHGQGELICHQGHGFSGIWDHGHIKEGTIRFPDHWPQAELTGRFTKETVESGNVRFKNGDVTNDPKRLQLFFEQMLHWLTCDFVRFNVLQLSSQKNKKRTADDDRPGQIAMENDNKKMKIEKNDDKELEHNTTKYVKILTRNFDVFLFPLDEIPKCLQHKLTNSKKRYFWGFSTKSQDLIVDPELTCLQDPESQEEAMDANLQLENQIEKLITFFCFLDRRRAVDSSTLTENEKLEYDWEIWLM